MGAKSSKHAPKPFSTGLEKQGKINARIIHVLPANPTTPSSDVNVTSESVSRGSERAISMVDVDQDGSVNEEMDSYLDDSYTEVCVCVCVCKLCASTKSVFTNPQEHVKKPTKKSSAVDKKKGRMTKKKKVTPPIGTPKNSFVQRMFGKKNRSKKSFVQRLFWRKNRVAPSSPDCLSSPDPSTHSSVPSLYTWLLERGSLDDETFGYQVS